MSWIVSVFFSLPDVVRTLSPTVCARLVNTILAFESVKPSTSAHKQLSPHSSELPSSLSLGLRRLFRQDCVHMLLARARAYWRKLLSRRSQSPRSVRFKRWGKPSVAQVISRKRQENLAHSWRQRACRIMF